MSRRPLALACLALLLPSLAAAQSTVKKYFAFGDSITFGFGDTRAQPGYPPQLETLLISRGLQADVVNAGRNGETTAEGLSRINSVLNSASPGDVLLLMEGTNDINEQRISIETIVQNLDAMADRAEARGLEAVHATLVPRLPSANYDGRNQVTEALAGAIRELAWVEERRLADPFEVFFRQTDDFTRFYLGGPDKLHPNNAGYDLLAQIFADVVTNVDSVHPVTGRVLPADGALRVPASTPIQIDLYDFGAGIDLAFTKLLINGQVVDTPITGSARKLEIRYTPPQPWTGVVDVGIRSRDTANPSHTVERTVSHFEVEGATFLAGDIDRDGRVDGADLIALALRFGARQGDPRFSNTADVNGDAIIDGKDLAQLAANFGKRSF
jgi:lysophospholipase L1-like esterase